MQSTELENVQKSLVTRLGDLQHQQDVIIALGTPDENQLNLFISSESRANFARLHFHYLFNPGDDTSDHRVARLFCQWYWQLPLVRQIVQNAIYQTLSNRILGATHDREL